MSKTTALIAEDEPLLAGNLRVELARLWPELQIVAMAAHGQAALQLALTHQPQILFLDIRMPGMTGLEAAHALAEDWSGDTPFPLLVFVTAYDQYAVQAFEHAAIDYVLKPVQAERLAQTCQRLKSTLALRESQRIPAKAAGMHESVHAAVEQLRQLLAAPGLIASDASAAPLRLLQVAAGNNIHMVPVDEVLYLEAADKYVRVVTQEREHLARISLRELLPKLDPQIFWQVHRGTVVRSDAIELVQRDETGKLSLHLRGSKDRLSVSRMYAHLFKAL